MLAGTNENVSGLIGIDDFARIHLKVAKVLEAEEIEGSDNAFISNLGNVRRTTKTGKSIQARKSSLGYMEFSPGGKYKSKERVHRLVALSFLENPEGKKEVNVKVKFKDGYFISNINLEQIIKETVKSDASVGNLVKSEVQQKDSVCGSCHIF